MNKGVSIFLELSQREIKTRFLESFSGVAWLILQPLLLLWIYSFVFVVIFKARVPEADTTGFVPYLAVAFWPWIAFSESVLRSVSAITENSELIGKVALPSEVFPTATISATFVMHIIGYLAVLLVLTFTGTNIHWLMIIPALLLLCLVYVFALSLGLFLSSLSVFIRDFEHVMPPLMTLWFFTTPILYSIDLIPAWLQQYLYFNPFVYFVATLREMLLFGTWRPGTDDLVAVALVGLIGLLAVRFFRRLSPRFEDFF
jgi:ABC-type polysaccharide/polyol phosphate export permease